MTQIDEVDEKAVEEYILAYFQAWEDARMEKPETLEKVLDYYADTVNIFKNPNPSDPAFDFSRPYEFNASAPNVIRKGDIWEELVVKFVSACPGLVHDPKMMTIRSLGEGIWEAWVFYDFKTVWPTGPDNVATVSIYTVDMNEVREDGGRGRTIRVINVLDNPV